MQFHNDTNFCLVVVFATIYKRKSEDIWHFGKILMEFGSISARGMHNPFVKECRCSILYGTESK